MLFLAVPVLLVAAACGSANNGGPTDHAWMATGIADASGTIQPVVDGTAPSLGFEGDTAAGNASCNQYSGIFELDGSAISFGPFISTQMACGEPGVMEQETAFLSALQSVDAWSIDGETMTLSSAGSPVLEFAVISQDLAGTSWDLLAYHNGTGGFQSAWGDEPVTATFADDGTVAGTAGCNNYTASWETEDGTITIGPAASTKMTCADEQIMTQESRYLELLELADTYRVNADVLEMFDADGMRILQYQRSAG